MNRNQFLPYQNLLTYVKIITIENKIVLQMVDALKIFS
jgi:hypothetical protein